MSSHEPAILKTLDGQAMPLTGVCAKGVLAGDLFELEVEQRYRNDGRKNIEAVYTFPIPPGAVLLTLEFELNGKTLSGVAVEKKEAERQYEDAIDEGDTAILLERSQAGLYTVNLGNLMAGEEAVVRYRYAEPLAWEQGRLRLAIPTTVAPRYGDALAAGLQHHQVPEADLGVAYPFTLSIDILGDLAKGAIASPTHSLATAVIDDGLRVSLAKGWLDRDFVLLVEGVGHSQVSVARNGEAWVAMAAFCPELPDTATDLPLSLRLVIDCSGSMGGDSILAARRGALKVVESLRDADEFDVTLFGSQHRHVFARLMPADRRQINAARPHLMAIDANMGGTEMEAALASACALQSAHKGGCLLLITDGEIWGVDSLIVSARASGLRYFVVGVGSSPSHTTLRRLADETGGSYEVASPNEDVEAAILRLFARMRQPRARDLHLIWEQHPAWQVPLPKALFKGDTLHAFVGFDTAPGGKVRLQYRLDDGTVREEWAPLTACPGQAATLTCIAAARRIEAVNQVEEVLGEPALTKRQMTELAVTHNLVTEFTHYVVIHERAEAEKEGDLPETVKVRSMLAAGWGGSGTLMCSIRRASPSFAPEVDYDIPCSIRQVARPATGHARQSERLKSFFDSGDLSGSYDLPAFLRQRTTTDDRLDAWVQHMAEWIKAGRPIEVAAFDELLRLVSPEAAEALKEIAGLEGHEEAVRTFLVAYARSPLGDALPRHLRRDLRHLDSKYVETQTLYKRLRDAIKRVFSEATG